jgi:hypothetical protein
VPSPGHALGRTLIEGLRLDPARAAQLRAADRDRVARNLAWTRAARSQAAPRAGPLAQPVPLLLLLLLLLLVGAAVTRACRLRVDRPVWLLAVAGYPATLAALLLVERCDVSWSAISSRGDAESTLLWTLAWIAAAHAISALFVLRRCGHAADRLAAASGVTAAGLLLAHLVPTATAIACGAPPWVDLPPAAMLFLFPAMHLALATYAAAAALALALEIVVYWTRVWFAATATEVAWRRSNHQGTSRAAHPVLTTPSPISQVTAS